MSDLIYKIVGTIIEVGQSDTGKFRLGEAIRYTPSEILEILKQHENEIFSLENLPSVQSQTEIDELCDNCDNVKAVCAHYPCQQYIDIEIISNIRAEYNCFDEAEEPKYHALSAAIKALKQPEQKKGKWIDETFKPWGLVHHPYKCDQCGEHSECDSEYCPNCGAKMER